MDFPDELIGVWSADALFGPGAQSDEIIAFKNDGTGGVEVSNFGLGTLDLFEWSPTSPGWIAIAWARSFELLSGGRKSETEVAPGTLHLPFQITTKIAPNGEEMRVLRLEILPFGDHIFGLIEADAFHWPTPFRITS